MASTFSNILGKNVDAFAVCGVVALSYVALRLVSSILHGVRAFFLSSGIDFKKCGQWAVVTGATDGIGKAYAQELAQRGVDVVLISRSPEKLGEVAAEIETKYNVKTKVVAVDFTGGSEIYDRVRKELNGLDIGTLVNNVGMSYPFPQYFGELPTDKQVLDMLNVNMTSTTMMTRVVLPVMIEKKKGAIINIASGSGSIPTVLLAQYSATKAYTDFFSRSLQAEYRSKGIIIQSVLPYFVATKLSKLRNTSALIPTPGSYARSALNTVGVQDRTFGCLPHAIQGYVSHLVPEWVYHKVTFATILPARARALKKQAKQQ